MQVPSSAEPEPAPAPAPKPLEPLVVTVTEEDCPLGEYKCTKLSQIREGPAMDSPKCGQLDAHEKIELLETQVLEDGLVRCRFKDGWVSAQTRSGERMYAPPNPRPCPNFSSSPGL